MQEYGKLNFEVKSGEDEMELGQAYQGSMQQILSQNTGNYVRCEFLIGTERLISKEGILYSVGVSFLTLYDQSQGSYVVCDLYSLKFVTFYDVQNM